ncbi:hypothetical protein ElyMa_003045800 [Elysia marginata]|uniref:Uncharacterized protein n=1 Tax=Elysia marginata TaxID=1093978 RepID=A0AAV4IHF3_9GAST|nr:hypothetical protein ElyMa_003045800 [Elysia marginata]
MKPQGSVKHRQLFRCFLYVGSLVLNLMSQCRCEAPDSSLDVFDPSHYYFSLPMFNFGAYFYVAFPNETLNKLYESLCDIHITQCKLTYSWFDELNRGRFPYYYTVTDTIQERAPDYLRVEEIYSSDFVCDTLIQAKLGNITCRRLRMDDNLCERRRCQKYSVQLNATQCSHGCGMLLWVAEYDLKILYFNFGDVPEPVKDGTCVEPKAVKSTTAAILTENTNKNDTVYNGSIPYPNSSNTADSIPSPDLKSSKSSSLSTPILAGLVGSGFLIITLAVVLCFRRVKTGKRKSGVSSSDSSTATPDSSTSTPELNKSDLLERETEGLSQEDREFKIYHTLDEMSDNIGQNRNFDECDEQGYHIIQDCETKDQRSYTSGDGKRCRPLPSPPNFDKKRLQSMSFEGTGTGQSSSSSSSSALADTLTLSLPHSFCAGDEGLPPPAFPFSSRRPDKDAESIAFPALPRPHRRQIDLEDHQYMGLVNLRHGHPVLDHVTEVKLVRTQQGHLELVSAQDGSAEFTEYYARLLLINEPGGAVGVVGLQHSHGSCNVDSIPNSHLSIEKREPSTQTPKHGSTCEYDNRGGGDDGNSWDAGKESLHVVYFGSLNLMEEVSVSPCDYLTAIDIDPSEISSSSDGYLTVLHIDHIKQSAGSSNHTYLELI